MIDHVPCAGPARPALLRAQHNDRTTRAHMGTIMQLEPPWGPPHGHNTPPKTPDHKQTAPLGPLF